MNEELVCACRRVPCECALMATAETLEQMREERRRAEADGRFVREPVGNTGLFRLVPAPTVI